MRARRLWDLLLPVAFSGFSGYILFISVIAPASIGSHAVIYTEAAAAWLAGENPWLVGPPAAVFAGPPPMLVPFIPFVGLSPDVTRVAWVGIAATAAILSVRSLSLPPYWLAFPPIFQAVMLGHPEVVLLWAIVSGGALGGLALTIKPYAGAPLLAERRWAALLVGVGVLVLTAPLLPWAQFIEHLPVIADNLSRQANGDSVFGSPLLMGVAVATLATFGLRRALWLATPLLWPNAQFMYRTLSVPAVSPVIALVWALPVPGSTLFGLALDRTIRGISQRRPIPAWLTRGVEPIATRPAA